MSFSYYKSCTIQTGQVPSSQANFPVLLPFLAADNDFRTIANGGKNTSASGYDIRPYSDSILTSALNFELVTYNASTGIFEMWCKTTAVDGGVVYVAHGNSALTTDGSSTSTWPSTYKIVAHYPNGSSLTTNDSTSNARNGTKTGSLSAVAGKIDGGMQFGTTTDKVNYGTAAIPTTGSHSFWYYPTFDIDGAGHPMGLHAWDTPSSSFFLTCVYPATVDLIFGWFHSSTTGFVQTPASVLTKNAWNFLTLTWDSAAPAVKLYLSGSQIGSTTAINATFSTSGLNLIHGYNSDDGLTPTSGDKTDELRLLDTVLSANWITAEYHNQNDLAAFWTKGSDTSTITDITLTTTPTATLSLIGQATGTGSFTLTPNAVAVWTGLSGDTFLSSPNAVCSFNGLSTALSPFTSTPSATVAFLVGYVIASFAYTPTATVAFIGQSTTIGQAVLTPSVACVFAGKGTTGGPITLTPTASVSFTGFKTDLDTYLRRYLNDI